MPSIETSNLEDYAVLWTAAALDNYGRPSVYSPIEIQVRWEDLTTLSSSPQDTIQTLNAEIFVDCDIPIESILWHGRLEDLPSSPTGLVKVIETDSIPDIKGRVSQKSVRAIRHKDVLPTVITL